MRVAYYAARWTDEMNTFGGKFFTLAGRPVAKSHGYHAPVGEDGGTFAGHWYTRRAEDGTMRKGQLGGIYLNDNRFGGQATYRDVPFVMTGGWVRLDENGGVAIAIVENCN